MSVEKAKEYLSLIAKDERLNALNKEFDAEDLKKAADELDLDDVSGGWRTIVHLMGMPLRS